MPEAEEVVVLVVDDHAPIRELVRAVLEGAGYAVREAADGAAALALAGRAPPAVILLDARPARAGRPRLPHRLPRGARPARSGRAHDGRGPGRRGAAGGDAGGRRAPGQAVRPGRAPRRRGAGARLAATACVG